ncbi:MAG: DUF4224 domain-containing protein [Nitrosomonas sp.]|nr:DUF4224 domain-containing protein [Nitrosomonas sp.]
MSIFLDDDDVAQLTGYTKKSKQVQWLDRRCWTFEISRLGKVKVLRKYAEMKLGMPIDNNLTQSTEPDFTKL